MIFRILLICLCLCLCACNDPSYEELPTQPYIPTWLQNEETTAPEPEPTQCLISHDFVNGIGAFNGVLWQETKTGLVNVSYGWDAQLSYPIRTDFDSRKMQVRFIAKSDDAQLVIGNKNSSNLAASTFYGVDFSAGKLQIYLNWNNDISAPVAPVEKDTELELVVDREYILEYNRETLFSGKVILRDGVTGAYDSLDVTTNACKGWDDPCIIAVSGAVEVRSVEYAHTMPMETKLAVFGDSFVEGANLGYGAINSRYVQLMADKLGDDIFIDSRGGESTSGVLKKYPTDSLCAAEYTLLAVGTNDVTYETWLSNIKALIDLVEKSGSKPILVTITRRLDMDNLEFIRRANSWVRSSGYAYLDVAYAVSLNNDGETINPELYINDNVHPNEAGHRKIFEQSLKDLAFLYS